MTSLSLSICGGDIEHAATIQELPLHLYDAGESIAWLMLMPPRIPKVVSPAHPAGSARCAPNKFLSHNRILVDGRYILLKDHPPGRVGVEFLRVDSTEPGLTVCSGAVGVECSSEFSLHGISLQQRLLSLSGGITMLLSGSSVMSGSPAWRSDIDDQFAVAIEVLSTVPSA